MIIKNVNVRNPLSSYKSNSKLENKSTSKDVKEFTDRVELSDMAKTLRVEEENEFRINEKRIEELRLKIERGEYSIDPKETAAAMIDFMRN